MRSTSLSYINPRQQSYDTLKNSLDLGPNAASKFDILNASLRNTVVMAGELIILGDSSTPSSTSTEAFMMIKAREIHLGLMANGGNSSFIAVHYETISAMLGYSALGIGTSTGAWAKRLTQIQGTLSDIETLYQQSLGKHSILSRNEFLTRRRAMFGLLDNQLKGFAAIGSGLKNTRGVRSMLGISTNSYLRHGEISGYAQRIDKVARAAQFMRIGGYVGVGLNIAASGVNIYQACATGREDECMEAKYVEGGKLVGGIGIGTLSGMAGGAIGKAVCIVGLGVATGGWGLFACVLLGSAAGGYAGGIKGGALGEGIGQYIYKSHGD